MGKQRLAMMYKHSDRISSYIVNLLNKFEVALAIDDDNVLLPTLLPTHDEIITPDILAKVDRRILLHIFISKIIML